MKKMFRFKYEPCAGMCYVWCDSMIRALDKLSKQEQKDLVALMVNAHEWLCDNPEYSFGVDVTASHDAYVAHFRTPEKTDLYFGKTFQEVTNQVCNAVLAADIPQISGNCVFGETGSKSLGEEILKFCQDLSLLEEKHCECKAHAQ